jgi:hypothetical protein
MSDKVTAAVKLSGAIDISSIRGSFGKLKEAIGANQSLEIDIADVTDVDLTFIQLIESARLSAAQLGTDIRLSSPAQGLILETLKRGGFLGDPLDERSRFWTAQAGASR